MKNKTDFYALVQVFAKNDGDMIAMTLWEARKMALREPSPNKNLIEQINGALRIRFTDLAPGLKK